MDRTPSQHYPMPDIRFFSFPSPCEPTAASSLHRQRSQQQRYQPRPKKQASHSSEDPSSCVPRRRLFFFFFSSFLFSVPYPHGGPQAYGSIALHCVHAYTHSYLTSAYGMMHLHTTAPLRCVGRMSYFFFNTSFFLFPRRFSRPGYGRGWRDGLGQGKGKRAAVRIRGEGWRHMDEEGRKYEVGCREGYGRLGRRNV
ncbi:hypothetical protein F5X68DRAFT_72152 [Plectosphaerella plurivora]|uniref:Uncharacterized protein n=1 Tax=Plectosphaerella plurivora TaxID=936078 RepID=A0A9P8VGG0_9PEZI|nr:hypothetical protein F5X68DRAFT_72152 [Plectosphaerella plurivora]